MRGAIGWFAVALSSGVLAAADRPLPPADGGPAVNVPAGRELERQIISRDQALFDLQFGATCDVNAMRGFVTDDIEFYHDKEGFAVDSGAQWASDYGRLCARRRDRGEHVRRELVKDMVVISLIPNYGAVESGEHRFYARQSDGTERLTQRARFTKLWRLGGDGKWRLARSFSFDHREVR